VKHIQSIDNQTYTLEYGYNLVGDLSTFQNSVNDAIARGVYSADKPSSSRHPGQSDSGARENRTLNSQQIGFGPNGAFVDIDRGNPSNGLAGIIVHLIELADPRKTSPFAVGRGRGSSTTGYSCRK